MSASGSPGEFVQWDFCSCDRTYHDECPTHGVYGHGMGPSGKKDRPTSPRKFLRGFTLWRFSRVGRSWAINATRWLYLSRGGYPGERRWFIRVGTWPGWSRIFGRVVRG